MKKKMDIGGDFTTLNTVYYGNFDKKVVVM